MTQTLFSLAQKYGMDPSINSWKLTQMIREHEQGLCEEHLFPEGLIEKYSFDAKDTSKRAAVLFLDKTGEFILLVHEKCFPVEQRKIGPPKGRVKKGESLENARKREVAEEIGLDFAEYPHQVLWENCHSLGVQFDLHWYEVPVFRGREIAKVEWVRIEWLKVDIQENPSRYNLSLRKNFDRFNRFTPLPFPSSDTLEN